MVKFLGFSLCKITSMDLFEFPAKTKRPNVLNRPLKLTEDSKQVHDGT